MNQPYRVAQDLKLLADFVADVAIDYGSTPMITSGTAETPRPFRIICIFGMRFPVFQKRIVKTVISLKTESVVLILREIFV
jgi:hypothetical protein